MGIFSKKKDEFAPKLEDVTAAKPEVAEEKAAKSAKKASKKEEKAEAPKRGSLAKELGADAHSVLVAPVFTEKSAVLQTQNKYAFIVSKDATKVSVAAAVRDLYGVKPASVRMIVQLGKTVRFGKFSGKEKDVKKAIVTLKKGDSIAVME